MGPVAKPVGTKKPRGSVLFYDGETELGHKGKTRRPKDDIVGNKDTPRKGVAQHGSQSSSKVKNKAAVRPARPERAFGTKSQSSAQIPVPPPKGLPHNTYLKFFPAPVESNSIDEPSVGSSAASASGQLFQRLATKSAPSNSSSLSHSEFDSTLPASNTRHNLRTGANAQVLLNLTKDVLEAFSEVPYVKVIVAVALKIIEISDDIKRHKELCAELVEKVIGFARVVFEALLAFDHEKEPLDFSGIQSDLMQIETVFQSIYSILDDLKTSGMRSRLRSVISRDEITEKILEQDRRLDTAIAMFQFKSMIKLRKYAEVPVPDQLAKYEYNAQGSSRKSFTHRPRPQLFIGRNNEVQTIHIHLQNCFQTALPLRLCILGPGGIGKTSLALTIFHDDNIRTKFKQDRYFISCEAIPSADLLLAELATEFAISKDGDVLKTLLLHLQTNPCLLVLDNFETVWDSRDGRSQVESLLAEITSIDTVTLIMTMRGSQRPSGTRWSDVIPPLKPIDIDSAMLIFKAISGHYDKYARSLVKAVDCMPLAVTLLATLASVDGESTKALWLRWQIETTSMVEQGGGRLNNLEKSIELSILSPRLLSDPDALVFLGVLSMLPDGMSPESMKVCEAYFPDNVMVSKAVSSLRQNALIYEDTAENMRVLNPIRLFIRKQHQASRAAQAFLRGYFISLALQGTSYAEPGIRSRLEKETGNINAMLLEALDCATVEDLTEVVQATINFSHYTYVSGKASIQTISRAIERLETSNLPLPKTNDFNAIQIGGDTKAIIRRGIGGRLYISMAYFVKSWVEPAMDKPTTEVESSLKLRADCLGCLGQLLSQQSKFSLAEEKFRLAKNLHNRAGDVGGYAYDMLNLGLLLSQDEKSSEDALELFKQALALHQKVGDLPGKGYDLLAAGGTLRELHRFSESDAMFSEAASLFSDLQDTSGRASALNGLGTVMLSQSRLDEAATYLNDAAKLSAHVGDIIGQAESISGLAIISLLHSHLPEAQIRIQNSISLRDPYEDPDYLHILGRIFIGKEDWDQATNVLSHALAIHQNIGDSRGEADDLCYLASVQYSRGNYRVTQDLACRALSKIPGKATTAQIKALYALIMIHSSLFHVAKRELSWSLTVYEEIEDKMGQAHIFYLTGISYINLSNFEEATIHLKRALKLHTEVGHRKGMADALRLIAYIQFAQNLLPQATETTAEALQIHTDIGNRSGQGYCLYNQAVIFLCQGKFADAHRAINHALKLHEASQSKHGRARDLVLLSNILWTQQHDQANHTRNSRDNQPHDASCDADDTIATSLRHLNEGIGLFKGLGCFREMDNCVKQKLQMESPNQEDWKLNVII